MQAIQYKRDNTTRDQGAAELPVDLMNGTFEAAEVRDMLFALMDKQINSYKVRNWKSQVNKECCDGDCMSKISKLNEAKLAISELCDEARIFNKDLSIRSRITVELVDKNC